MAELATESEQYALIAGTGFQSFGDDALLHEVNTDFGAPSCAIRELNYGHRKVYFLARHGEDLQIPAHAVNYRANLRSPAVAWHDWNCCNQYCGCNRGPAVPRPAGGAAAADRLHVRPRAQYLWRRSLGKLDHIDFTEPFCGDLRKRLIESANLAEVECHYGGVYAVTQGPRLETAAEIDRLERDGADYVGMTAMPEASLARELGMRYACLSLIVNHAAGRGEQAIHAGPRSQHVDGKNAVDQDTARILR